MGVLYPLIYYLIWNTEEPQHKADLLQLPTAEGTAVPMDGNNAERRDPICQLSH